MKHLRKIYESEDNGIKFSDIINILYDLIDDDIPLSIISATGIVYKPEDISRKGIDDIFKLKRWALIPNQSFSIRIDDSMNYSKLCEIMIRMQSIIGRFEDFDFKLISFNMENIDTDEFSTNNLEYRFERSDSIN